MELHRLWRPIGAIFALLWLVACSGLPEAELKRAKEYPTVIAAAEKRLTDAERRWSDFGSHPEHRFLAPYAAKENWATHLADAKNSLAHARVVADQEVNPFTSRNKQEESSQFLAAMRKVDIALGSAERDMKFPFDRIQFLLDARKNADAIAAKANEESTTISGTLSALTSFTAKAKSDYPDKADAINAEYTALKALGDKATGDAFPKVQAAITDHRGGRPADYAALADGGNAITAALTALKAGDGKYRAHTGELYRDYSKTLVDMRSDCYVTVIRSSEDDSLDWPAEHDYTYQPRKVDKEVCAYFEAREGQELATYGGLFGKSLRTQLDQGMWDALRIDPAENWVRGDTDGYFEVETDGKYYHKYIIVENGIKKETDWTEVTEAEFDDYSDDLGMMIAAKPYGYYESEKMTAAMPPGMAYVGNPQYGAWKNHNGTSVWEFYGQYAFMRDIIFGPGMGYHSRSDWEHWRTNSGLGKKPWYGTSDDDERYGTGGSGVRDNSRWQSTDFAKSGGFRDHDASVRGAGPSTRGGGPGGSGK